MIFFVQSDGTITRVDSVPVYQGSANANTIYFVGTFAANNPVGVAFKLPNGIWTKPYLAFNGEEEKNVPNMTFVSQLPNVQTKNGVPYCVWKIQIDGAITKLSGVIDLQFFVFSTVESGSSVIATAKTSFTINGGVPFVVDEMQDDETVLQQILSFLSVLQDDLSVLQKDLTVAQNDLSVLTDKCEKNALKIVMSMPPLGSFIVKKNNVVGLTRIDWGDGMVENISDTSPETEYVHTYNNSKKHTLLFYGVTEIQADAFIAMSANVYLIDTGELLTKAGTFVDNQNPVSIFRSAQGFTFDSKARIYIGTNVQEMGYKAFQTQPTNNVFIRYRNENILPLFEAFGEGTNIIVPTDEYEAYQSAWKSNTLGYSIDSYALKSDVKNIDFSVIERNIQNNTNNIAENSKKIAKNTEEIEKVKKGGTTVLVGGEAVAEFDADTKVGFTDYANSETIKAGVVKVNGNNAGLKVTTDGYLQVSIASPISISLRNQTEVNYNNRAPISMGNLNIAVIAALTDDKRIIMNDEQKSVACDTLGAVAKQGESTAYGALYGYAYNSDNQKIIPYSPVPQPSNIPMYRGVGKGILQTDTPREALDCTNKDYVDNNFISNPKPSSNSVLLLQGGGEGTVSTSTYTNSYPFETAFYRCAKQTEGDTMLENANGYFLSNDPIRPYHTANKKYVDEKFVVTVFKAEDLDGNAFLFKVPGIVDSSNIPEGTYPLTLLDIADGYTACGFVMFNLNQYYVNYLDAETTTMKLVALYNIPAAVGHYLEPDMTPIN